MKVNCYFERGALHWSNISAHNFVYNKLVEKYPEIEFQAIHTAVDLMPQPDGTYKSMREYTNYTGPACKYGPFWMVIQNTANNKFFVVSYWDKLNDFFHTNWDTENCVEILTSIGLHQRDNHRLIETLKGMRDLGNSLLVVEHDEETIRSADHLIDIGPGAGIHGGKIVAFGSPTAVSKVKKSITGSYLRGEDKISIPSKRRNGNGKKLRAKTLKIQHIILLFIKDLFTRIEIRTYNIYQWCS